MIKKIIFLFFVVLAIIYFRGINNHMKTNNSNSKIRIVSLSPSVTKKIIELDKTEYLVGRTFFCNYNEVKNVDVEFVWYPVWTPERMSDAAKKYFKIQ